MTLVLPSLAPKDRMIELISRGLYNTADAARLLRIESGQVRVTSATVRRWAFGYRRKGRQYPGAIDPSVPPYRGAYALTFLELIELLTVRAFLEAGASWRMVRDTMRHVAQILPGPFPFARNPWFADPAGIYFSERADADGAPLLEVSSGGQLALENALLPYLKKIDFGSDGLAQVWHPMGRESPVVVDPRREFGAPVLKGTRISTEVLAELHREGKSAEDLAWWFGLRPAEVDAALQFEQLACRSA